jgi:anti-sigma regulatory factor (Ser/Thr protein kinase)
MHANTPHEQAGTGIPAAVRTFPGVPASVREARAWVAGFLPGDPAADDAALLTSELVTNSIVHSASGLPGGVVAVVVTAGDGQVRVDVLDQGEAAPSPDAPPGLGVGLVLVKELAAASGGDEAARWFILRTGGAR